MILGETFVMLIQSLNLDKTRWFLKSKQSRAGSVNVIVWLLAVVSFTHFYDATLRATLLAIRYTKPLDTVEGCIAVFTQM